MIILPICDWWNRNNNPESKAGFYVFTMCIFVYVAEQHAHIYYPILYHIHVNIVAHTNWYFKYDGEEFSNDFAGLFSWLYRLIIFPLSFSNHKFYTVLDTAIAHSHDLHYCSRTVMEVFSSSNDKLSILTEIFAWTQVVNKLPQLMHLSCWFTLRWKTLYTIIFDIMNAEQSHSILCNILQWTNLGTTSSKLTIFTKASRKTIGCPLRWCNHLTGGNFST